MQPRSRPILESSSCHSLFCQWHQAGLVMSPTIASHFWQVIVRCSFTAIQVGTPLKQDGIDSAHLMTVIGPTAVLGGPPRRTADVPSESTVGATRTCQL